MTGDTLANAERPLGDKPAPAVSRDIAIRDSDYWHGSAAGEVIRWQRRALAAEAKIEQLQQ